MTAYEGHNYIQPIRELRAYTRTAGTPSARRNVRERAGAASRLEPLRRTEGAPIARARWTDRQPCRGPNSTLSAEPAGAGSSGARTLPREAAGAGGRAPRASCRAAPTAQIDRQAAVTLSSRSSLADVAVAVGDALRRAGIRAVLTGGACANLYSGGAYASLDVDFVLAGSCTVEDLDRSLATLGFQRERDRYVHTRVRFFVEFPRGPLGIGEDFAIKPVWRSQRAARTLALSATDACRDRLAAFYHWNDRQSLAAAVAISTRHRVAQNKIRAWSHSEGHHEKYAVFLAELGRAHEPQHRRKAAPRS